MRSTWIEYNLNKTTTTFSGRRRADKLMIDDYFSEIFSGMKTDRGLRAILYNLFHVVRRLLFVWGTIALHEQPWIQAILFICASICVCIYLMAERPFQSKTQNRLEIANELMILITGYCVAVSVGWNLPTNHRLYVGLATIFFLSIVILFNIGRWLVFMIKYARMELFRLVNGRRMTKVQDRKIALEKEQAKLNSA